MGITDIRDVVDVEGLFIFYTICAAITAISSIISLGYASLALLSATNDGSAARNNALYSFSRSVAIALICCGVFTFHNLAYLAAVSIMMIVIAGIDGVIGRGISKVRMWLPWGMAVVNLVALLMVYAHFF